MLAAITFGSEVVTLSSAKDIRLWEPFEALGDGLNTSTDGKMDTGVDSIIE